MNVIKVVVTLLFLDSKNVKGRKA